MPVDKRWTKGLGARLRKLRQERRLSLDEAASQIGMSKTGLWDIEIAGHDPRASTLAALAILYCASLNYIILGKEGDAI